MTFNMISLVLVLPHNSKLSNILIWLGVATLYTIDRGYELSVATVVKISTSLKSRLRNDSLYSWLILFNSAVALSSSFVNCSFFWFSSISVGFWLYKSS